MIYSVGDNVVVNVNGTNRVGVVTIAKKLKKGWVYSVHLENGKTIESCSVNKELTTYHISRTLTKIFNNGN
jgi:hypothetical protein